MEYLHDMLYEKIQNEIVERLCEWAMGRSAGPVRMAFRPTERCDLKCLYCVGILIDKSLYNKESLKKENELSKKEWVRIAKEGAELGIKEWDVCGGEPLLRSDTVLSMIRTIKKISPESLIVLATNGSFLTAKIAEKLVRSECDIIQLSIDGGNTETHDFLRGKKGSFDSVTNAGRLLASMKKDLGKERPILQVNTVINSKNYYELPKLASLAYSLGASHFIANPMRVGDMNLPFVKKANLELTDEQITSFPEIWKEVEKIEKQFDVHVSTGYYGGKIESWKRKNEVEKNFLKEHIERFLDTFCFGPFYSLTVDASGNVGRCAGDSTVNSPINLRGKSLEEVWYGSFFESARKLMLEEKPLGDECKVCGMVTERFFICNKFSSFVGKRGPEIYTHKHGNVLATHTARHMELLEKR